MSRLAVALAKFDKKKIAQEDMDVAWRLAWRDTHHEQFADMLSYITDAQLAAGFVRQAFDTAARIPDEEAPPSRQGMRTLTHQAFQISTQPGIAECRYVRGREGIASRIWPSGPSARSRTRLRAPMRSRVLLSPLLTRKVASWRKRFLELFAGDFKKFPI